ncbi:hypothetical protein [Streptomyces sp. NPDC050560]|uniref:hypothetical protein n=1 Tax=Streptomyces sp. NPDC050560 TaxID=3365630 RepID=UPI00379140ED
MPRGRHRHSPPLHRLLPSSVIGSIAVACAAGAWFAPEPVVMRSLAAGAAVAALAGAAVMRSWDRLAGRQVADLNRGRASDEWRYEERVAELEGDLEESRELRHKMELKLRGKRAELARLRGEHAALLRRYATAETERASALEGRRLLEIEAAVPAKALAAAPRRNALAGPRRDDVPHAPAGISGVLTPSLYLLANAALKNLAASSPAPRPAPEQEPRGREQEREQRSAQGHFTVPTAAAVVPPAAVRRPTLEGGFDFFGTKNEAPGELDSVRNGDLADVVGDEALAVHKAAAEAEFRPAGEGERGIGQVIDLTAHDETEQLDMSELRGAVS